MHEALLVELPSEHSLRRSIERVRELGYHGALETFTPFPVAGIESQLSLRRPRLNWVLVPAVFVGFAFGYLIQRWCNVQAYAIDVGGRPDLATPSFVIITWVTGVLVGYFVALALFFVASGLPRLHQKIFELDGFERATLDRFWLALDAEHATFDRDAIARALRELGAEQIATIDAEGVV